MDSNYYLSCRKISCNLKYYIEDLITKNSKNHLKLKEEDLFFFLSIKDLIENKEKKYVEKIQMCCIHEMVEDWIDISPDRSKNIIYCKHCEWEET